jgi:hypothetical protein
MEQLQIDIINISPTIESIFQEIADCLITSGIPTDVLKVKPLQQSGTASILALEKIMCKIAIKQQLAFIQVRLRFEKQAEAAGLIFEADRLLENYIRIPISDEQPVSAMKLVLQEAFKMAYRENADTSFGCCSRFIECSDARKCTNPKPLFALGCAYKDNLENDRIFYGQHPTV